MHTEHLQNVTAGRVVAGWLVAAAITSLAAFALIATGLMTEESTLANTWWSVLAVVIGFAAGGFFTGFRAMQAPVLHAVGIGLASLAVWAVLNAIAFVFFPDWQWPSLTPELTVGLLLTQMVAAMIGALIGYNVAVQGRPGLGEHEPV